MSEYNRNFDDIDDDKTSEDNVFGRISIGQINIDAQKFGQEPDYDALPILATRGLVMFPGVTMPIQLGREISLKVAEQASESSRPIGIVSQRDADLDTVRTLKDLYDLGVVADVLKVFEMPDGTHMALIRAREKFKVLGPSEAEPDNPLLLKVKPVAERIPGASADVEFACLVDSIKETAKELIKKGNNNQPNELIFNIDNNSDAVIVINQVASYSPIPHAEKIELLRSSQLKDRAFKLLSKLSRLLELASIVNELKMRTGENINQQQRRAFLTAQLETIKDELYGDDEDAAKLRERAGDVKLSEEARRLFDREISKLARLNPQSPDYAVLYSYLELLLDLPWGKTDELSTDLPEARRILDADHFGLEKVKERIVEQLAVMMNTPESHAPIICLVGAPGVGKTSLGKSIAAALGRKYQRVSLGGLHDEAELRGHRRTYIGAMPGRIIDALRRAGSSNPVLLLDEIDKISNDFHGDPASALLEVLDPEQNNRFHDNYVDVDYDLSKVLFIATANSLSTIQQPLLDRMEIIDISGYLLEEKVEIAKRHLIPRLFSEHKFSPDELKISDEAIVKIIDGYTGESGVRQLDKKLGSLMRKAVIARVEKKDFPKEIKADDLKELLGVAPYSKDRYQGNDYAGVVTGLAWTSAGGEILYIETSAARGKGEKLTLTGQLGDVMKESATIALQYIRSHADSLGIDPRVFEQYQLHIHVPEGAIPKDGPSAGITIATSIASALTRRKVADRIAMTGEITLRGLVLPVGGIKEKILAAKRAGVNRIILSEENRKNVGEIPAKYLEGMTFDFVKDIREVLDLALTDEKVGEDLKVE